jgi:UDP-N-acetylmuramate dehydrogenase
MSAELSSLIKTMKPGRLQPCVPLAPLSWFRSGGCADYLFQPETEAELAFLLKNLPHEIPIFILGLGSNILIRDGGVEGIVIRLGKGFSTAAQEEKRTLRVGASLPDVKVANLAAHHGIGGLAFLRGIPGTIGGLLRMNGGAYGGDAQSITKQVRALDRFGESHLLSHDAMGFSYRHSQASPSLIFTEAFFEGYEEDPKIISEKMHAVAHERNTTQPVNTRTGGSTFKNPPGKKAWELIDAAGCRGLRCGHAQVSHQHCNFLINTGHATSHELEALGEEVRRRVADHSGIMLEWEIKCIGRSLPPSEIFHFETT